MKKQSNTTENNAKRTKLKNLVPLSKNQLETIIGGPETDRGTVTVITP